MFESEQSLFFDSTRGEQQRQTRSGTGWQIETRRHESSLVHDVKHCELLTIDLVVSFGIRMNDRTQKENLGIIVQYKVKVKLIVAMGG